MKLGIEEVMDSLNDYIEYIHRHNGKFYITLKNDKSFYKEIEKWEKLDFVSYIFEKGK